MALTFEGGVLQFKTMSGLHLRVALHAEHMQSLLVKISADTFFDKDELATLERCFDTKVTRCPTSVVVLL